MTDQKKRSSKVDLEKITSELIAGIKEVDSDESLSRSEKTKAITRLATKVKNRLYDDKRRKEGDKIAPSTYRKYLTLLRRAVTEQNWVHHNLESQVATLAKRYPRYSDSLGSLIGLGINELREKWSEILSAAKNNRDDDAHQDIKAMKLDHEVMRHLTMPSATKETLEDDQREHRYQKISHQVTLNHSWLVGTIYDLLTKKSKVVDGVYVYTYSQLALGLALATGRRQIEILKQGKIKKVGEYQVKFVGQAKKRGGADYSESMTIYTLVEAQLVVEAWGILREQPEIMALNEFDTLPETTRNARINSRCSGTLNRLTKRTFENDRFVFKDSRDIWARAVHDIYYPEWQRKHKRSEDLFWQEMLGHEDTETQIGYKKFHINYEENISEPEAAVSGQVRSRLDGIKTLDENSEIQRRVAMQKIHAWVKEQLADDDNAVINQSRITRELGSSRGAIKDYLGLADEALNDEVLESAPAPVVEEVMVRPHFSAKRTKKGCWRVVLTMGEHVYSWEGRAESQLEAMKKSYKKFIDNNLIKSPN